MTRLAQNVMAVADKKRREIAQSAESEGAAGRYRRGQSEGALRALFCEFAVRYDADGL